MSLLHILLQRIGVAPAERRLFGWAGLCLFLMGAAAFGLMNTAESLFLKRVGVEALPLALLASSGLLVLTTGLVGRFVSANPPRSLPWVLAGLALTPLPFALLAGSREPILFGAFVLAARQILALGMLAFWLAMGSLVPGRRAKTLFAPLAAGVTLGGIVGSFGSGPMARLVGVDGLIGLCAVLLAGSAVLGTRLRHSGVRRLERETGAPPGSGTAGNVGFLTLFRTSRLFRLLGVALLCGGALSPVLYFEFTTVLDGATQGPDGEQQLLSLYSQFRGWLNVAILVFQVWLGSYLYRRIGLPLSMVLWPVTYVVGFAWLGFDFALFVAFATFGATRVTESGISDSAARVLYNLFPDGVRARATGLLEGPVHRLGGVLGNGFVLGALALGGTAWLGVSSLLVAALWFVSAIVLWRAYPGLLLRASAEHGLAGAGIDRATLLDAATLRRLTRGLVDPDPRMCRAAVDLVIDGEPSQSIALLAEAIEHAPASNRPVLVEALHGLVEPLAPGLSRSDAARQAVARSLQARPPLPPDERADLLRVYARLSSGDAAEASSARQVESTALIERLLGDRAASVRLAAVAELHRRGAPPPGLPDLNGTLAAALAASDALIRRAARKELRAILLASPLDESWSDRLRLLAGHLEQRADRLDTAQALLEVARRHGSETREVARDALRYAKDRDARVRGTLLRLAGYAGVADEGPRLVSALGSRAPEEAAGAREGLVALGSEAALPLLVGIDLGGTAQREGVISVLRELAVESETIERLRDRQLDAIREGVAQRAAVNDWEGVLATLLRRRLDERTSEGLGALLDLLSTIHDDPRIREIERRLRRSSAGRERDLQIEAIEELLGRRERDVIVPLLESDDWRQRARAVGVDPDQSLPEAAQTLTELRSSSDSTTRLLAAEIALERSDVIGDPEPMPTTMEIAVHLQAVPAFDRLSTQQLMALAEVLQEQKAAAGEAIYRAGDEGIGLYFVLEGDVELRRGDLILRRASAGSFFGEIATLDGVPHSADAVASTPALLLRLDRDDLLPLLEDVPSLAIGMAQLLSSQIRRLEDRLESAVSQNEPTS